MECAKAKAKAKAKASHELSRPKLPTVRELTDGGTVAPRLDDTGVSRGREA